MNKNTNDLNMIKALNFSDKFNNNKIKDNKNLNNNMTNNTNNEGMKNSEENKNVKDNLNSIENKINNDIYNSKNNENSTDNYNLNVNRFLNMNDNKNPKGSSINTNNENSPPNANNNTTNETEAQENKSNILKNGNENIKIDENKLINEKQKESTENTDKTLCNKLKNDLKTVKTYLTEECTRYKKEKYNPYNLQRILRNNKNFVKTDISYVNYIERKFDPINKLNDKILNDLLNKLDLNSPVPDITKYGYFCYINNYNENSEGLYSTIDSEMLYYDITKINYEAKDFYVLDDEKRKIYLMGRAKSLEYFIDKSVFEKKYGTMTLPRIIYPLMENYYEKEIEIDGCFYVQKSFKLKYDEFPFESKFYKNNFYYIKSNWNNYRNSFNFLEGDVCLLEIKTNLPSYKQSINDYSYEKTFSKIIDEFLNKMIIFEQLFKNIGINYKRIRLILFYDAVKKCNYQKYLNEILSEFAKNKSHLDYMNKIYFQVIYMDFNYFAYSLTKFEDEIAILKFNLNDIKRRYEEIGEKYNDMNKKYEEIGEKYNDMNKKYEETKEKYNDMNKKIEETKEKNNVMNKKYEETKEKNNVMNKKYEETEGKFNDIYQIYEVTEEKYNDIYQKYNNVNEALKNYEAIFQLLYNNMDEETKKAYEELKKKNK